MTYEWRQDFGIIMDQVAEEDLATFLKRVDNLETSDPGRLEARSRLRHFPICLIHTMTYIHNQKVQHKDIKPQNILIRNGKICLTDFGLARDFSDDTTSGTGDDVGHTRMYAAPEVLELGARKGRSADIFSLGCVFLEISAVYSGGKCSLEEFKKSRTTEHGGPAFANCPFQLIDWMWWTFRKIAEDSETRPDSNPLLGARLLQLAFHMLDPIPKKRITAVQLVAMLRSPSENNFNAMGELACIECWLTSRPESFDRTASTVRRFRPLDELIELPVQKDTTDIWEVTKDRWLQAPG
jgi:serine/threonine protein kinase